MQTAPNKWTLHHTHRIFHLVILAHIFIVLVLVFSLIMIQAWQVQSQSADVNLTAKVPSIIDGPHITESGTSFSPPPAPTPTPTPTPDQTPQPTLDKKAPMVESKPFAETPVGDDQTSQAKESATIEVPGVGSVPLLRTSTPTFRGHTNIAFALIYLEIHSTIIRATTQADQNGDWTWESTEILDKGLHKIIIESVDPNNEAIHATTTVNFYIKPATAQTKNTQPRNTVALDNGGNLFDILVSIPSQFQEIQPGDQLLAKIKLVNFGKAGQPVDVEVQYTIENDQGKVILQSSETLAVATQISFIKTFFTSQDLPSGFYKLITRVPSRNLIATATTTFKISGASVAALGNGKIDYSTVFQALIGLFLFFCIVGYMEFNKVTALSGIIRQIDETDLITQINT